MMIANELVAANPAFAQVKGPGSGNYATNELMRELRRAVAVHFGQDHSEQRVCGEATALAVDFYFREASTIVEIALGLQNPGTEFEKDILKALIAKELGHPVDRLVLISRAGGRKKCNQPGRPSHGRDKSIVSPSRYAKSLGSRAHHGVGVSVNERALLD